MIEELKKTSKLQVAKKYGVYPNRIREWCKQEGQLREERLSNKKSKEKTKHRSRKVGSEIALETMFYK